MRIFVLSFCLISAAAEPKIVVPAVTVTSVAPEVGTVVTELILEALLNRHGVRALGPSDLREMLDAEQQKLLLGCDKESCMAQIAGAMGADRLIAGMVSKLGDLHVVTLKLIDTRSAEVTSRASRRFTKVEEVPDAVGPLVDDLLQASPKVRATTPAALRGDERTVPKERVMDVTVFCKRSKNHAQGLVSNAWSATLVLERRALLEDLLHTPFLKEFEQKTLCVRQHDGRTTAELMSFWKKSQSEDEALDRRRRMTEWRELTRLLELLDEAYRAGFEKEQKGVGARPDVLPFEVLARDPEAPDATPEVRRYLDDYLGAQRAVAVALETVKTGNEKAFKAMWTADDPKVRRNGIDYVYRQVSDIYKNGYTVDACPIFVLPPRDIEQNAENYAKNGLIEGCVRKTKDGYTYFDAVYLRIVVKQGWMLDRW